MEWQIILALVLAVPIISFPVALVWYLNVRAMRTAWEEARKKKAMEATEPVHHFPRGLSNLG